MTACPFCDRIAAGEYGVSDQHAVSFEPLGPVTPGHLLIVPREHVRDAGESPLVTGRVMALAAQIAGPLEWADSYNLITSAGAVASQTVFHLHIHLVPRRLGDGLALPWPQDPKCTYCYCRLADAPECAEGCAHRDLSGHVGCAGPMVPPSARAPRRSTRPIRRAPGGPR